MLAHAMVAEPPPAARVYLATQMKLEPWSVTLTPLPKSTPGGSRKPRVPATYRLASPLPETNQSTRKTGKPALGHQEG